MALKVLAYHQAGNRNKQKDKNGSTENCQNVSYALLPLDGSGRPPIRAYQQWWLQI